TVKSKVGAGDSFVGGFTWALAKGNDLPTALAHGSAAASAACMTEGTELCRKDDFVECLARTESTPL
ncbi:PfkB family carbohydrate kinase, partial [Marivivens donghaensis]|uniref:PfkB family carbohydrate kinase n=1 Tax=Marivivens donghaensis TaxID=1699413 RepID=UPI003F698758